MVHIYKLKLSVICLGLLAVQAVSAQTKIGGSVGAGDPSALLELQSTGNNQGFLPPRLTTAQRNTITTPATGLTIYNTDDQCLNIYKGSTNGWFNVCSGGGGFSFTNCSTPTVVGTINLGSATTATVTLNYVNNTGQAYGAFVSGTTNGITLTAPGGGATAIAAGAGSITLTASGTPTVQGAINVPILLAGIVCSVPLTAAGCGDPGTTAGNTGCVSFTYQGASVIYTTVRAKDGHIWIQQNLGSSRVATASNDASAYGDLFQWGRWDDGGQLRTSPVVAALTLSSNTPAGLGAGSPSYYIYNGTGNNAWWFNGLSTDTWSGTTASATNGIDPCAALGTGWRLPTITEWSTVMNSTHEVINSTATALSSNLKMPASGYRDWATGNLGGIGTGIQYSSSSASTTSGAQGNQYYVDNSGGTLNTGGNATRGQGLAVRCLK